MSELDTALKTAATAGKVHKWGPSISLEDKDFGEWSSIIIACDCCNGNFEIRREDFETVLAKLRKSLSEHANIHDLH
jgi:hypothetical protein